MNELGYMQPRTSALEIFRTPDPPEAPPPEAGPPDRGPHFKGLLEGQTNARTAPAEGEKKKGPRTTTATQAEETPAPNHEGATGEAPQAPVTTGAPAEPSPEQAAAQSEPNAQLIGGEASGAAGAAVAVGAAAAAPLISSSLGEAGAPGVTPRNNSMEVPGSDPASPLPAAEQDETAPEGKTAPGTAKIELPAVAEIVAEAKPTTSTPTAPVAQAEAPVKGRDPEASGGEEPQGKQNAPQAPQAKPAPTPTTCVSISAHNT